MFDVITIGSATTDVFVETEKANIVSVFSKKEQVDLMAYPYGSKMEIDAFSIETGGGAVNSAANFANLGMKTSAIIKLGDDFTSDTIVEKLKKMNIDGSNVIRSKTESSGFSIILVSFQGDRTVLAHRGANATLSSDEIDFDAIKQSKWLYIAPLNGKTNEVLDDIAMFAEKHDVNMAINLGTTSIKQGKKHLAKILETAEIVLLNKEEASMLTGITVRQDTKTEKFSDEIIHEDVKTMLKQIKSMHAKIVVITDGKKGVYAFDGQRFYQCGEFPATVVSTLGAGDAFASTFCASLERTGWDVKKSLEFASVNAGSVVEHFGAQDGLLTFEQIEKKLQENKEFQATVL